MRYAFNGDTEIQAQSSYDVLIVGAGLAGLYTAIQIPPQLRCAVLSKEGIDTSNSWLAQGGIAAAIDKNDRPRYHFEDTLVAGAGLCDKQAVRVLVDEGPGDIWNLVTLNVPFDQSDDGDLEITMEGGHGRRRIVHAGGDATGRETVKTLATLAAQRENISFVEHSFLVDILTDGSGAVSGALILNARGETELISAPKVVIATGGIGQVYAHSTNPVVATGDGLAAAMRAGAQLKNMEFIQFHPTGLYSADAEDRAFLISEAVRGEGGLLKNKDGVRFMEGAHPLNELAPRDIVARGIFRELERSGEDHVYVDICHKGREFLEHRFPTIYNECMSRGIDIAKDWIPVCPVQHYLMGGIATNLDGETSVPGLYACGEAAYTGVHGANRLASNSMLECLVFGRRAAHHIGKTFAAQNSAAALPLQPVRPACGEDPTQLRREIQQTMNEFGFVFRWKEGLKTALERIRAIRSRLEQGASCDRAWLEVLNLSQVAEVILESALARPESVGAHYRQN